MLIEIKGLIQKKRQNWVGIFREKTILCQPIDSFASRPNFNQQTTLKTFQDNTTFKEYFRSFIILQKKGGWDPNCPSRKNQNHYNPEILLM
jgi:hypothetical protein